MQYICEKTKMSILVVGTVAFDAIETKHGKTDKIVGGAATYICHSAAPFSNNIKLVSVVGDDFPKYEIIKLEKKGVDALGLQIKKGEKTFFWSGKYHDDMNIRDTIETQLNVLEGFVPDVPKSFRKSKILMLGNLMPSVQQKVLDQMQERPDLIILDTMNFWMDNFLEDLLKSLKEVDILTINDEEARQLSGEDTLVKAAKKITKMGPKYLIIKKGEHGSMLFGKEKIFLTPAYPLETVIDPTGAGDSFAGGLVGYLSGCEKINFQNIRRAILYATAAASFCVQKFGTEGAEKVTISEVEKRVNYLKDITKF